MVNGVLLTIPRIRDEKRKSFACASRTIFADGRRVGGLDAAAQRKRQQLLGQRADEQLRALEQRLLQAAPRR